MLKLNHAIVGDDTMWDSLKRPCGWMLLGGLLVGAGVVLGLWASGRGGVTHNWAARFPRLREQVLHASTASGGDNFAVATGAIDQDAEGIFVLDFLTGNLQCSVLNRNTMKFSALFRTNVAKDLGQTKNSKYQMVTGLVNFRRGGGTYRPGMSVVYVLDSSSGRLMAYGVPWLREAAATGRPQIGSLLPIDALQVRMVQVRDQ